jgi:uncharacterized protein (DUF983 family)
MNIIDVAKKRDEIMASLIIHCPICGEKQFSPFDKLYVSAYETCVMCDTADNVEQRGDNIFSIVNS